MTASTSASPPQGRRCPSPPACSKPSSCNSVLEYVQLRHLADLLLEIDRVLAPGGVLLVLGTSNRLWPREVHSGR